MHTASLSQFLSLMLIGKKKQDFSPIKVCPAASIFTEVMTLDGHSSPKAATGLYSLFSLCCHKTPDKSDLRKEAFVLHNSEPIIARKVRPRSLQQLLTLHPKAGSKGRWDSSLWDRTAHSEGGSSKLN